MNQFILGLNSYKRVNVVAMLLFVLCFQSTITAQEIPSIKQGDKVCFIGNSITQDGRYHMLFQSFFATRFPGNEVEFYNCGIAGDVATGMIKRFDKDIWAHKPDIAFLMTGMNDVMQYLYMPDALVDSTNLSQRQQAIEAYYKNTEKLASMLHDKGVETVFITPSIYDETSKIEKGNNVGVNDALKKCAIHIKKLAKQYNATVVDFSSMMEAINLEGQKADSFFTIVGHDRVHPGDVGHFTMAYEMIKTVTPTSIVSNIVIDGKKKKLVTADNADVQITSKKKGVSFDVLEKALPFPVLKQYQPALKWIDFDEELNQEILVVENLKQGDYKLSIDGLEIGDFSYEDMAKGINLAKYETTPQYKQAVQVLDLCSQYHKIMGKLRTIAFIEYRMLGDYDGPDNFEGKRAYLQAKLDADIGESWHAWNSKNVTNYFELVPQQNAFWDEIKQLRSEIYKRNIPVKHTYTLSKN